jgi:hypothetical protein
MPKLSPAFFLDRTGITRSMPSCCHLNCARLPSFSLNLRPSTFVSNEMKSAGSCLSPYGVEH